VSLLDFQRALADMVASPELALRVRGGDDTALARYELTERERRRLATVAAQPGMEVNCTLYRTNRLSPVVMLLPYTCFVLGGRMGSLADRFWSESRTDLQFRSEIDRFAAFLRERLESGELVEPLLEEVLAFELATNELRFLPRRRILAHLEPVNGSLVQLHPLVRLVPFRHHPENLLRRLAATEPLPYELEEGDFLLVLIAGSDELDVRRVDGSLADLLRALARGPLLLEPEDARLLIEEGLAAPAGGEDSPSGALEPAGPRRRNC